MAADISAEAAPWWHAGTIYQVYPRSFQDTDGDGVGDLAGVRARLPYLKALGVDALWLSPIFRSPMADHGYDVADYCDIDPLFGTMADFDALLADAHALGLRLLLDFVPNHSSDRHAWFEASRSARDDPKRDWYIWRDPAPGGGPPNNWTSYFGGPAWTFDPTTGQYYLHLFLKEQPDLNWRSPELRAAMLAAMRFWFDKGVDGFRIDVLWHVFKDAALRDNPPDPAWRPGMQDILRTIPVHSGDQPEMAALVTEMRALAERYPEPRLLIGEIYLPLDRLMTYYGVDGAGLQLPFNFALIDAPWDAAALRDIIESYEAALPPGGWPNWVIGNHDRPRIAARIGEAQARVAMTLLLTLRGTPTLYYGDELGLGRVAISPDRIQDPQARREPGIAFNRDEARTPMPWTGAANGGFADAQPWLPINADLASRNVAAAAEDDGSMLALTRRLLALRKAYPVLGLGDYRTIGVYGPVLAYERVLEGQRIGMILNLSDAPTMVTLPDAYARGTLLARAAMPSSLALAPRVQIAPNDGLVILADVGDADDRRPGENGG